MPGNADKSGFAKKILVVDDDRDILILLKNFLVKHGFEVEIAANAVQAEKLIDVFDPDLVMCDYRLDDMDGSELLSKIKEKKSDLPVIIITGYSDLRTAIKVLRMGAFDYMTKPFIPDEILNTLHQALERKSQQLAASRSIARTNYLFPNSVHSQNLEQQINLVATTDYSVIIYGESGAGKEGVARMIHERSKRKNGPFVAMDCGAISRELAGSELFGHEKGAFTGAHNQKIGHFEMADGGTLFLDEIGNLPYEVQTLLLRVLQEKSLRRLGSTKERSIDVRIIVASNERLLEVCRKGKFREDLYHRLNEFDIEILPLRERKEDIMFFADHFLKEIGAELGKNLDGFEPNVEEVFFNYPWPGNIRELKNTIRRAALLVNKNIVGIRALPFELLKHSKIAFDGELSGATNGHDSISGKENGNGFHPQGSSPEDKTGSSGLVLKKAALEAEYGMILDALNKVNFNKSKAARILNIDRKTLYNKMKQMKLLSK